MVKIVFSDFDNTMLHYYSDKNFFDEYQLGILKRLNDEGIIFCIVTGRNITFFEKFPKLLQYVHYILESNGGAIYDVRNKKFIYSKLIGNDDLVKLIDYAKKEKLLFILNSFDKRYQYGEWSDVACDFYQEGKVYFCVQIVVAVLKEKMDIFCQFLSTLQKVVVNNVADWGEQCSLDVNVAGVSKGNAIKWLCQYLGVDIHDTLAFGDGENDISMFQVVGKGVAVGNSCDKLKQISDDVSLNCKDNGVYKYLEDNVLE